MEDVEVVGECATGSEVLERVRLGDVDVLLLDIEMPGLSGIDTTSLLPEGGPVVVFCTAHPAHAVAAFDLDAADYILKPIDAARLQRAMARAAARRALPPAEPSGHQAATPRLAVPTRRGVVLLDPDDISHATLEDGLVTIHTLSGNTLTDFPLLELEQKIGRSAQFERVHRRALLNWEHVTRLEPLDSGGFRAHVRSGATVEVSRQSARSVRRRLGL